MHRAEVAVLGNAGRTMGCALLLAALELTSPLAGLLLA